VFCNACYQNLACTARPLTRRGSPSTSRDASRLIVVRAAVRRPAALLGYRNFAAQAV
jgi:hypothetical protein